MVRIRHFIDEGLAWSALVVPVVIIGSLLVLLFAPLADPEYVKGWSFLYNLYSQYFDLNFYLFTALVGFGVGGFLVLIEDLPWIDFEDVWDTFRSMIGVGAGFALIFLFLTSLVSKGSITFGEILANALVTVITPLMYLIGIGGVIFAMSPWFFIGLLFVFIFWKILR